MIGKYYAIADIFVTASTTETQGLTVIEAMAASIPVVAINDESFNQVVIDGLNGKIFNNKKEYKKIVIDLLENEDVRRRLSRQARISAEKYSAKYFADQVLDVYKIAIGNSEKDKNLLDKMKNVIKKGFHD